MVPGDCHGPMALAMTVGVVGAREAGGVGGRGAFTGGSMTLPYNGGARATARVAPTRGCRNGGSEPPALRLGGGFGGKFGKNGQTIACVMGEGMV